MEVAQATGGSIRAFLAICWRDVFVTVIQLPAFLIQMLLQPLFLLFVLGRVLPDLGFASASYATALVPGVVALTIILTAIQSTAFPLVFEFSYTKEIEDRLLAPLPVAFVGAQKIVIASLRSIAAGIIVFPFGNWIIGSSLHLSTHHLVTASLFCVMGAVVGSGMGLTMGTLVEATQINVVFALILTPLLFTGCIQYPWASLDHLRWFQIITLFNPLTYVSEGLRASLVPQMPHMTAWVAALVLALLIALFSAMGLAGFVRRAID